MFPYILLMFAPLLFSFVKIVKRNRKRIIVLGSEREVLDHSLLLPVFFFILTVILCLRGETIGRDLVKYRYYYEKIIILDLKKSVELFRDQIDVLFILLNWVVGRFTEDFQIYLAVVAVITVLPIAKLYCQDREHGFLKLVLFINMSTFVMLFSGLRQSVAMAMGLVAYEYVKRKKFLSFFFFAIVALGFHHTAFMVLFYYPLYHATFKKKHLLIVIPVVAAVFVFNEPIFTALAGVLSRLFSDKYAVTAESTGAYTMLFVFAAFAVLAYVIPDEKSMDRETLGLRNFLILAVILQCFAPIHMLAMRMNYYYIIFIPILIPKIFKHAKGFSYESILLVKSAIVIFFAGYYLVTTYSSCQTGISALDTYPYIPFWK
ncbi:MAG: EpsG family protein [Oscillospiraceae bacterium]|nr:EpsG family protein [Oscillospiraceae bacterium]